MESADNDLEGEGGTKAQPKGLVFKIASKRKCCPLFQVLSGVWWLLLLCLIFFLFRRLRFWTVTVSCPVSEEVPKHFCFPWAIRAAKTWLELCWELWILLFLFTSGAAFSSSLLQCVLVFSSQSVETLPWWLRSCYCQEACLLSFLSALRTPPGLDHGVTIHCFPLA